MEDGDKDTHSSPAQLASMVMGFLFSAGGAGAGIALVGKEGFQIYGIVLFGICAVLGLIFYYAESRRNLKQLEAENQRAKAEQRSRDNLKQLADLYASSVKDAGSLLAVRLEGRANEMEALLKNNNIETIKENLINLRTDVLKILIDDLRGQGKTENPKYSPEVLSHFQDGLNEITERWQTLSVSVSLKVGLPDDGAKPIEE